ncbi:MAG: cupin domain-containing protein [Candidatus Thorarchaeota archaeon]|jgi:quercetin dioxygenase-like cupin family protein
MKKKKLSEMTPSKIEGEIGSVRVYDPLPDEISAGVRVVGQSSDVPKKPHIHPEKQIIYVISGSGKITNGEITFDLGPGDFVTLESNEAHYVTTQEQELTIFEVKYSV